MGVFGEAASPFDEGVEKVTAETLTSENWALMIDICDRVTAEGARACKQCLVSVKKRLNHRDPHVVLLALSLLDCLWNNCGALFRREVSSKEFISELSYKATNSNRVVGDKTRELIKKWCENECKKDDSLSLVVSLYKELIDGGYTFEDSPATNGQKKKTVFSNDPNVVHTEEEEADIAKAIALSLNDEKEKKPKQTSYPAFSSIQTPIASVQPTQSVQRKVKALYDFEAAEDNELSFNTGDIIALLDDSDPNWWRGSSSRGTGLFPASFVTSDLQPSPVQNKTQEPSISQPALPRVQIDEETLLKCIQMLDDLDPTGEVPDPADLPYYEQMSLAQGPLIDTKLAQIDKQTNLLAQVDVAIRDVLANYDGAVQQVQYQMQQNYNGAQPGVYTPNQYPIQAAGPMNQQPLAGGQTASLSHIPQQTSNQNIPQSSDQPTQNFINHYQHQG